VSEKERSETSFAKKSKKFFHNFIFSEYKECTIKLRELNTITEEYRIPNHSLFLLDSSDLDLVL
jgi:hypothetical protein